MLYLTYYNGHNDGFGAQYQRILGIYSICKEYDIGYYHTEISDIGYQGVNALELNSNDEQFIINCNDRIKIINSDVIFEKTLLSLNIDLETLLKIKQHSIHNNILLKIRYPYNITDNIINIYSHCHDIYKINIPKNKIFTIGMHVRRGDLFLEAYKERMLPNEHYINIAKRIIKICEKIGIKYIIELYTELPNKDIIITPNHPGINNVISSDIIISRDNHFIEDFDVLPNLVKYINEDLLSSFDRMINSDIFISSKSSLSSCVSYLKKGITIYHKFWHTFNTKDIDYLDPLFEDRVFNFINNNYR